MCDNNSTHVIEHSGPGRVTKNTTVKNHGEIRGFIRTNYGTTFFGPSPRVCGVCGKPAKWRTEGGSYYCDKHKKPLGWPGPDGKKISVKWFKLKYPGSVELADTNVSIRDDDVELVEI